jgi:hypothetical protein
MFEEMKSQKRRMVGKQKTNVKQGKSMMKNGRSTKDCSSHIFSKDKIELIVTQPLITIITRGRGSHHRFSLPTLL